ncbi:MAG TPA: hypothetical protein PKO06_18320, partial [Candidatus Ozemobacteraceae bacterium]|nr:hypothetical protein [Candidatus Ozemobacteraceae bacterium]
MKRSVGILLAVLALTVSPVWSASQEELKYLGYSDEITNFSEEQLRSTHKGETEAPPAVAQPLPQVRGDRAYEEATAVQEQLTELGKARSLTAETPDRSQEVKDRIGTYWQGLNNDETAKVQVLSEEFKNELKVKLESALQEAGYAIRRLDLVDLPPNLGTPQVRAVIRVVKPLKTNNGYQEIQKNLGQIKDICNVVGNVNGINYLGELSTFVAENPRNQY